MEKLLREFQNYVSAKGYKERGIAKILHAVQQYIQYAAEHHLDIYRVSIGEAEKYREYLMTHTHRGKLYSAATVNSKLSSIRCFYRYLFLHNSVFSNPFSSVSDVKRGDPLIKGILKQDEMAHLLDSFPRESSYDVTICIVLEVLYASGMRIGEAASLRVEDVDCDRGYVTIREDKSGKDRICVLTEYGAALLQLYIRTMNPQTLVFEHFATGRALRGKVNQKLAYITRKENLPHISCHSFRHSMATHLLENGADIRQVQELLGHTHIRQTERYTRVTTQALKEVVQTYHPRENDYVPAAV